MGSTPTSPIYEILTLQFQQFYKASNCIYLLHFIVIVIVNRTYEFDTKDDYNNLYNSKVYALDSKHYTKVYDTAMSLNLDTSSYYCLCLTVQYYITFKCMSHCYKVCLNWWLNEKPIRCILQLCNYVVWVLFSL